MRPASEFEFPPAQAAVMRKAVRLEIVTIAYVSSAALLVFATMGSSQAMRTSFFEDLVSLVPSFAFLAGAWIAPRRCDADHPYGYHGVVSIGYLTASIALLAMGLFLLIEAVLKIGHDERTTIGAMELFGVTVWAGWPMLATVAYSAIPPAIIGHVKLGLAPQINDKVLYAGATMMKADWMTAAATGIGVIGVGIGAWWLDPVAAIVVSLSILHDGFTNVRVAVDDLIERRPMKVDRSAFDALPDRLAQHMTQLGWVDHAEVRLREVGHVYFGEAFVTPKDGVEDLPRRIMAAIETAKALDWRLRDLTITPIPHPSRDP